jgi:hypothetical protein
MSTEVIICENAGDPTKRRGVRQTTQAEGAVVPHTPDRRMSSRLGRREQLGCPGIPRGDWYSEGEGSPAQHQSGRCADRDRRDPPGLRPSLDAHGEPSEDSLAGDGEDGRCLRPVPSSARSLFIRCSAALVYIQSLDRRPISQKKRVTSHCCHLWLIIHGGALASMKGPVAGLTEDPPRAMTNHDQRSTP